MSTDPFPLSRELLDVKDLAVYLKMPVPWIYQRTRRRSANRLPHYKLGKYIRFDLSEVLQWLKSQSRS